MEWVLVAYIFFGSSNMLAMSDLVEQKHIGTFESKTVCEIVKGTKDYNKLPFYMRSLQEKHYFCISTKQIAKFDPISKITAKK